MSEYAFDVKLFALIRVKAKNELEARFALFERVDEASANLGAWEDGSPIVVQVNMDGADLIEIDGEDV